MTVNAIATDLYSPSPGEYIVLYQLDLEPITGVYDDVFYFCETSFSTEAVRWKGKGGKEVTYQPIDVEATDFEITTKGTLPRPKLRVSNVNMTLVSQIISCNDLLGAIVTRYRTLKKYLGGQPTKNYNAHLPEDVFIVERKSTQNKFYIEWELRAAIDLEGLKLPRRLILRDVCPWIYRIYKNGAFVYNTSSNRCPLRTDFSTNAITGRIIALGTYDFTSGWTLGTGWSVNNGAVHSAGNEGILSCPTYSLANTKYVAHINVELTAGYLDIGFDGGDLERVSSTGDHTLNLLSPESSNTNIVIVPSSCFVSKINSFWMDLYLDRYDISTWNPADDVCGKRLESCRRRFYKNPLPYGGFPSVGKVRV